MITSLSCAPYTASRTVAKECRSASRQTHVSTAAYLCQRRLGREKTERLVRVITHQLPVLIIQRTRVRAAVVPNGAARVHERLGLARGEHPAEWWRSAR